MKKLRLRKRKARIGNVVVLVLGFYKYCVPTKLVIGCGLALKFGKRSLGRIKTTGCIVEAFNRLIRKQFVTQLKVIAIAHLPGRKQTGHFGGRQSVHEDLHRLGSYAGFVLNGQVHIFFRLLMKVTGL